MMDGDYDENKKNSDKKILAVDYNERLNFS